MSDLASFFFYSPQDSRESVSLGQEEQGRNDEIRKRETGVSWRRSVLSFRRSGGEESAPTELTGGSGSFEPRDPVARPAPKARAEGAAHPIYELYEEPAQVKPVDRPTETLSQKTELDIRAFVDAVEAAFPNPRDPDMARVLRTRPKRAARPFLYVTDETEVVNKVAEAASIASGSEEGGQAVPGVEPSRAGLRRNLDVLLYDPILEGAAYPPAEPRQPSPRVVEIAAQDVPKPAGLGRWTPGMPDRRARRREQAPVEAHERMLIEAVIEPQEPVSKPRLPILSESVPGVPARLSPYQRALLNRPKVVRDCHGRLTPVAYRIDRA